MNLQSKDKMRYIIDKRLYIYDYFSPSLGAIIVY